MLCQLDSSLCVYICYRLYQSTYIISRLNTALEIGRLHRVLHSENVLSFHGLKMADISKDGLLLGGGIHHITATQAEVKKSSCLRT